MATKEVTHDGRWWLDPNIQMARDYHLEATIHLNSKTRKIIVNWRREEYSRDS